MLVVGIHERRWLAPGMRCRRPLNVTLDGVFCRLYDTRLVQTQEFLVDCYTCKAIRMFSKRHHLSDLF